MLFAFKLCLVGCHLFSFIYYIVCPFLTHSLIKYRVSMKTHNYVMCVCVPLFLCVCMRHGTSACLTLYLARVHTNPYSWYVYAYVDRIRPWIG